MPEYFCDYFNDTNEVIKIGVECPELIPPTPTMDGMSLPGIATEDKYYIELRNREKRRAWRVYLTKEGMNRLADGILKITGGDIKK